MILLFAKLCLFFQTKHFLQLIYFWGDKTRGRRIVTVPVRGDTHLSTQNNSLPLPHQSSHVVAINFCIWLDWIYNGQWQQFFLLLFLHFFLDFSWLMLHPLQNLGSIYSSSWGFFCKVTCTFLPMLVISYYVNSDFGDFCWSLSEK